MRVQSHLAGVVLGFLVLLVAVPAAAQPVGTFRWQLFPFCNVVTHRLLTEHLGITHVVAVIGPSMRGMQALQ